jgi:hypothetical protein
VATRRARPAPSRPEKSLRESGSANTKVAGHRALGLGPHSPFAGLVVTRLRTRIRLGLWELLRQGRKPPWPQCRSMPVGLRAPRPCCRCRPARTTHRSEVLCTNRSISAVPVRSQDNARLTKFEPATSGVKAATEATGDRNYRLAQRFLVDPTGCDRLRRASTRTACVVGVVGRRQASIDNGARPPQCREGLWHAATSSDGRSKIAVGSGGTPPRSASG